jgi:multiple sugar transport system substrate-binding protein
MLFRKSAPALVAFLCIAALAGPVSAEPVGKQPPITIEINSSPWYASFEAIVDRYEKETGNKITLDVTPYPGMLQKARDAVRGSESTHDLISEALQSRKAETQIGRAGKRWPKARTIGSGK